MNTMPVPLRDPVTLMIYGMFPATGPNWQCQLHRWGHLIQVMVKCQAGSEYHSWGIPLPLPSWIVCLTEAHHPA